MNTKFLLLFIFLFSSSSYYAIGQEEKKAEPKVQTLPKDTPIKSPVTPAKVDSEEDAEELTNQIESIKTEFAKITDQSKDVKTKFDAYLKGITSLQKKLDSITAVREAERKRNYLMVNLFEFSQVPIYMESSEEPFYTVPPIPLSKRKEKDQKKLGIKPKINFETISIDSSIIDLDESKINILIFTSAGIYKNSEPITPSTNSNNLKDVKLVHYGSGIYKSSAIRLGDALLFWNPNDFKAKGQGLITPFNNTLIFY